MEVRYQHYRDLDGRFDRILSVEMLEHVGPKNDGSLMNVERRCLDDSGMQFAFCNPDVSRLRRIEAIACILVRRDLRFRSPAAVEQSLADALARDRYLSEYDLMVAVEEERATLRGMVRSEFDKRRAESVASSIRGISEVQNNLMVESAVPEPVSDLNLKYRIENRLYWSPLIDDSEITVAVNGGRVTLTGVVDSPNAFEIASQVAGKSGAKGFFGEASGTCSAGRLESWACPFAFWISVPGQRPFFGGSANASVETLMLQKLV